MIKEIFDTKEEPHKSSGKFSISGIGGCWRKKFLEIKGLYKEEYDAKSIRTFAIGDLFHRQAVKEITERAPQCGFQVLTGEVNIPEQKYISGRIDLILVKQDTGERFVVDIKSCGDYTLNEAIQGRASQQYIDQVNLYLHFLGIKRGYLLFYGKHKGAIEEVAVEYNKDRALQQIKEIEDFYKNYVEKNIEPEPCQNQKWGCNCCHPQKTLSGFVPVK